MDPGAPGESFMQNKPNLLKRQMNVSEDYTEDYENKRLRRNRKNKANSKPIRSQNKPKQTQFLYQKPHFFKIPDF